MASPTLDRGSPTRLANCGQTIETKRIVGDFERLVDAVASELRLLPAAERPRQWRQAPVDIRLRYGWSDSQPGVPSLQGRIATRVAAVCQRCLEPFDLAITTELKLLLPAPDAPPVTSDEYEVWEFEDDAVSPHDIVEEALVMAMPFSPMHPSDDACAAARQDTEIGDNETLRPFADLRSLMAGKETQD